MNYFANKNTLIWIIIALLAINVAAITTIIIFMGSARNFHPQMMKNGEPPAFLRNELGLSPMQSRNFDRMHIEFREKTSGVIHELDSLRYEMMEELSNENPDSLKLDKIAEEIGTWHSKLKKQTIYHFKQMKRNCNVEQRRNLSRIYRKMQEPPMRGFKENRQDRHKKYDKYGRKGQMNRRYKNNPQ